MPDFTQYVVPGVYVSENPNPVVATVGVPPTTVCIVGPAIGYESFTEPLVVDDTVGVAFSKRGVYRTNPSGQTGFIPVVTLTNGTALVENTDYTLTDDSSAGAENKVTLITRIGGSTLLTADGMTVIVSYRYTDASYYTARTFEDYDEVVAAYGQPFVSTAPANPNTTQVISPLTLAAKVAFENGANRVILLPTDSVADTVAYRTQLTNAYAKIATNFDTNVIVPLFVGQIVQADVTNMAQDLKTHLATATADGYPRIGIIGVPKNYNVVGGVSTGFDTLAIAVDSSRVMLAYPNALNIYNGLINQNAEVDGYYLAAAYAGRLAALEVEKALTKEFLNSFAGLTPTVQRQQTKSFKDNLSKNGVAVAELDRQNRLSIRHGVSTDMTSVLTRELSITRARDVLFLLLQEGITAAGLIGTPLDDLTPTRVKGVVAGILENARLNGIIVAYADLKARQQSLPAGDPTAIDVKFAYRPAVPLNYILVSFSINLETGETTLAA